jgi:hypothetical protein
VAAPSADLLDRLWTLAHGEVAELVWISPENAKRLVFMSEIPSSEQSDLEPSAWAVEAFEQAGHMYASYMGDPDGNDDTETARSEAAKVIERLALAALQPSPSPASNDHMIDMANVGEALMEAIRDYSGAEFMKNWHPADCPSEIVGDLLNALEEAQTQRAASNGAMPAAGMGEVERVARRNLRHFINAASFKCRADQEAAIKCLEVLEEGLDHGNDLIAVLRSAVAAEAGLSAAKIAAWLRNDADLTEAESRKIITDSHSLSPRDIQDWQGLVATKRGIAAAIERGDYRQALTPDPTRDEGGEA